FNNTEMEDNWEMDRFLAADFEEMGNSPWAQKLKNKKQRVAKRIAKMAELLNRRKQRLTEIEQEGKEAADYLEGMKNTMKDYGVSDKPKDKEPSSGQIAPQNLIKLAPQQKKKEEEGKKKVNNLIQNVEEDHEIKLIDDELDILKKDSNSSIIDILGDEDSKSIDEGKSAGKKLLPILEAPDPDMVVETGRKKTDTARKIEKNQQKKRDHDWVLYESKDDKGTILNPRELSKRAKGPNAIGSSKKQIANKDLIIDDDGSVIDLTIKKKNLLDDSSDSIIKIRDDKEDKLEPLIKVPESNNTSFSESESDSEIITTSKKKEKTDIPGMSEGKKKTFSTKSSVQLSKAINNVFGSDKGIEVYMGFRKKLSALLQKTAGKAAAKCEARLAVLFMVRAACQNPGLELILKGLIQLPFSTSKQKKELIKNYELLVDYIQKSIDADTLRAIAEEMELHIDKEKLAKERAKAAKKLKKGKK
ncbi:MAG: hypothetical protein IJ679_07235, partial [Lachnospiraceae bacterium]|nr:hypothetical protein [Lachnospiraceae bacterium]